jgi:hypothetical protein
VAETLRLFHFRRRAFLQAFDSVEQSLGRVSCGTDATAEPRRTTEHCGAIATLANNITQKALNA